LGFCASPFLHLIGRRYDVNYVGARAFYSIYSRLVGVHIVVEGEEHLEMRPCVFVANHQSMLDVFWLGNIIPVGTRMMAKKSLKYMPILGQFMVAGGAVWIDRGNSALTVRSLKAAGEEIKKTRTSMWIFAEGTRTSRPYHDIQPFKKGAFHLATQAGLPIVPIVAENYWDIYRPGHFRSGTFKVRVLPPIPTEGLTGADVGDLATRVREQMLEALREISDPNAPPPPVAPAQTISKSQSEKENPAVAPPTPKETTPVPLAGGVDVPQPRNVPEERPETPHSEVTSEASSIRRSDTEEEEGMVLVGRPR